MVLFSPSSAHLYRWTRKLGAIKLIVISVLALRIIWALQNQMNENIKSPAASTINSLELTNRTLPKWNLIRQDSLVQDICTHPKRQIVNIEGGLSAIPDDWTIMMTLSEGYYDFFQNWYLHFQKLDSMDVDLVLFAEDEVVYRHLSEANYPRATIVRTYLEKLTGKDQTQSFGYSSWRYVALVAKRPSRMLDLLCTGRNVIYVDTDTLWQSNPLPYFQDDAYLTSSSSNTSGAIASTNERPIDIFMLVDWWNDKNYAHKVQFCTGLIAVRANRRSLQLISNWEAQLRKRKAMDQQVFNAMYSDLFRYRGPDMLQDAAQRIVPYVQPLSTDLFPNGKQFFQKFNTTQRKMAVQVHVNFYTGHGNKKQNLEQHGLWLLERQETSNTQ